MRRILQFFGLADNAFSIWTFLKGAGWLSAFAIPAWAARAGGFMSQYAPFSWIAAGIVCFFLIMAALWLRSKAMDAAQLTRLRQRVSDEGGTANPLEKTFTNKRIRIADLAPPIGGFIEGKQFVDCELIGPANLMFQNCTFQRNGGQAVDGIVLDDNAYPHNGFGFRDCGFANCRFYLVTFMVPRPLLDDFMRWSWTGMNWISNSPETNKIDAEPQKKEVESPQGRIVEALMRRQKADDR